MLYFTRWKVTVVLLICLGGLLFAAPNALPSRVLEALPSWWPTQRVNLGLDLRGGSHLLLEVDLDAVVEERLEAVVDDARRVLRGGRIGYRGLGVADKAVQVRISDPAAMPEAVALLAELAVPVRSSLFNVAPAPDLEVTGADGLVSLRLTEEALLERERAAVEQSIEIVRRRIDELGTTEPTIQRQGGRRILVQAPGLDDPERLKELLGRTAKLSFRLVDVNTPISQALAGQVPAGAEVLYSAGPQFTPYVVRKRVIMGGENLTNAQPGFDQITNEPIVTFRLDTAGARRFGDVTRENVGRPFAIVLDNEVISAPVIREPIVGGSGQVSGNFTVRSANDLAILLRAGALPAPLAILEERTVGPGLGADSIRAGSIASVIGLVAVIVFMVACYGRFGIYADVALLMNLVLILGLLSLLQATLTLPGIAGIVLTIGMAVDANVLIFERIREEERSGKSPVNAIESGYARALGTILDANITTLIAAAVLFQVGSGPVRGFAVTLGIGVVMSVFTAFTLTRLMVSRWLRTRRPKTLAI